MAVPTFDSLFNPIITALHNLGGSASNAELEEEVAKIINISEDDISQLMPNANISKFSHRLGWGRNFLKNFGILENTGRGIWALTAKGKQIHNVDKVEVKKFVRAIFAQKSKDISYGTSEDSNEISDQADWKNELINILFGLEPASFEKLCQRFLRESGFIHVEVSGRSGDGGIDGHGVVKIGGLLSFHVHFQCKRYRGSVSASVVRDFRGAMVGRADKGLIITTGTFTRDAKREAQRDGAPPIDLIDGDEFSDHLKRLGLGIETKKKVIEEIIINNNWFSNF